MCFLGSSCICNFLCGLFSVFAGVKCPGMSDGYQLVDLVVVVKVQIVRSFPLETFDQALKTQSHCPLDRVCYEGVTQCVGWSSQKLLRGQKFC